MQHFFRSIPFSPYAYTQYPDGTEVGKYTPNYNVITPQVKSVTREKFMDTKFRTNPLARKQRYPNCTQQGRSLCSMTTRSRLRNGKSLLSDSIIKKLKIYEKNDTKPSINVEEQASTTNSKRKDSEVRQSLKTSISSVEFRPKTAYNTHKNRMSQSRDFSNGELTGIRQFER